MSEENRTIEIRILDPSWTGRAHPFHVLTTGGHRAKAGEWFLEVERVLFDIYQTFKAMENFLNRGREDMYVGENKDKVKFSNADRIWILGYMADNAYLRVGSCLEKIAQMARVYYEHPDHGGPISVQPRCGKCDSEALTEANCSFGSLMKALHANTRVPAVDNALFALERSALLQKVKKGRNDITHRINKTPFYPGLDPSVKLEIEGNTQVTTFTLGQKHLTAAEYRKIIAEARNEIVDQLNVIGPLIFPEHKKPHPAT